MTAAMVGTFAVAASSASAAIVQYTDRAAFEAAAGALTLETFNGFAPANLAPSSDLGPFSVSTNGSAQILASGAINGSASLRLNITADSGGGGPGTATFTFDTGIVAFGGDFSSLNNNEPRTFATVGGVVFDPLPLEPAFLGFISTTAFTTVVFSNPLGGGNNDTFQLDNLAYAVGVVPEPATWGLMLLGFGGMGAVLRRTRRARSAIA